MSVVQIAKRAGVSISTVSRVLTNSQYVQPETRDRVQSAISELGLTEHHHRRRERRRSRLKSEGESIKSIGIITLGTGYKTWFADPVIAALVAEITSAASLQHAGIVLAEMLDVKKLCPAVENNQVDAALVLVPSGISPDAIETLSRQLPVVRVMGADASPSFTDHVSADHIGVGYLAAEFLVGQGCKNLAFITLTPGWTLCQQRASGFFTAIDQAGPTKGIHSATAYISPQPCDQIDNSYSARRIISGNWQTVMKQLAENRPDGLFVSREAELDQVYRMLAEIGITPGQDLKVVSCDNCETWLSRLPHRPATIDLCLSQIAQKAVAQVVMRRQAPNEPPIRLMIHPQLIPRL